MHDKEAIQMMQRCVSEIKQLRNQLAEAQPKADAYDLLEKIIGFIPGRARGSAEDVVWLLNKQIEKLQAEVNKVAD